jgi:hypothetical protein
MQLNNRLYDVLKELAQVWLPGLGTLYFALAGIWHLPAADKVVGSVVAVDAFLGVILKISTTTYNNSDAKFDGILSWENTPDGGSALRLKSVDVNALASQAGVLFKVVNSTPAVASPPKTS